MPQSALPEYLRNKENWKGTDWDNLFQRWLIPFIGIFSFGPRAKEWWARWRRFPLTIFAIRSKVGVLRLETEVMDVRDSSYDSATMERIVFKKNWFMFSNDRQSIVVPAYLSVIQYWARWHFALQWPFHVSFHFYFKKSDVPRYLTKPGASVDNKLVFIRFGARRDGDVYYRLPSVFIGLSWN